MTLLMYLALTFYNASYIVSYSRQLIGISGHSILHQALYSEILSSMYTRVTNCKLQKINSFTIELTMLSMN